MNRTIIPLHARSFIDRARRKVLEAMHYPVDTPWKDFCLGRDIPGLVQYIKAGTTLKSDSAIKIVIGDRVRDKGHGVAHRCTEEDAKEVIIAEPSQTRPSYEELYTFVYEKSVDISDSD